MDAPRPLLAIALVALLAAPAVGLLLARAVPSVPALTTQSPTASHAHTFQETPYAGASNATSVLAACPGAVTASIDCYTKQLKRLMAARGAVPAFDVLDAMTKSNTEIDLASHPIAHDLGINALDVYGDINTTLRNCSYKVFAGCFHGALQAYFVSLPKVDDAAVQGLCPADDAFRQYTCLHGMGHGLTLALHYDLNASLQRCSSLEGRFAESSCTGGVFMENFAGWRETQDKAASAVHEHLGGHSGAERYWIDPGDVAFPCDVVGARYQWDCWIFHTSVVLFLNGGNFSDAIARCAQLPDVPQEACFRSLGRDASSYRARDPLAGAEICTRATRPGQGHCARGFVADSIVFFADPEAGLPICRFFPDALKLDCYQEIGIQGRSIAPGRLATVCAQAESAFVEACRRAGGVT